MLHLGFQTNHTYFKDWTTVTSTSHFVSVSTALLSQISLLQKYGKPFIGDSSCIKRSTHSGGLCNIFAMISDQWWQTATAFCFKYIGHQLLGRFDGIDCEYTICSPLLVDEHSEWFTFAVHLNVLTTNFLQGVKRIVIATSFLRFLLVWAWNNMCMSVWLIVQRWA